MSSEIVLRVRIRSSREPAESERVDEGEDIFRWLARMRSQKLDHLARTWPTFALILLSRVDGEGLADVLLVDAHEAPCDSVEARGAGLQDVRRRPPARGNAPSFAVEEERRLWLSAAIQRRKQT